MGYLYRNIQRNKQQAYRNFKGFDMRFTFIAAAWQGTAHDSRVLENVIVDPEVRVSFSPHGILLEMHYITFILFL